MVSVGLGFGVEGSQLGILPATCCQSCIGSSNKEEAEEEATVSYILRQSPCCLFTSLLIVVSSYIEYAQDHKSTPQKLHNVQLEIYKKHQNRHNCYADRPCRVFAIRRKSGFSCPAMICRLQCKVRGVGLTFWV